MIRMLLVGVCIAIVGTVVAWFIIPASTYVEDALGILMATFIVVAVVAFVVQYFFWRKKT